jgi:AP-1 complex subunit beta-1
MSAPAAAGNDGKYFAGHKRGEIPELKADLNSLDKTKVKEAVKKVIAAMTVGKDVSSLFTDVVMSMQTDNIELKKLVYLYVINYARSHPHEALLVVNTFLKDATDKTRPLVRALAIRTMGCIRVDRITEYLCEPLGLALKDTDPYVRKTAAICVGKLYDINPELVQEQGFIDTLRDMIGDANPMVVANALAALTEISETSERPVFTIDSGILNKLLAALNECTEWGQVFILDALARYTPSAREAEEIVERVAPRLKHANSAVAMSAVKVIMTFLPFIQNEEVERKQVTEKLPPPLITLLSEHKPEVQYVALRNINLIVQKRPEILANAVKNFFCK